jgi:hypothetical protein
MPTSMRSEILLGNAGLRWKQRQHAQRHADNSGNPNSNQQEALLLHASIISRSPPDAGPFSAEPGWNRENRAEPEEDQSQVQSSM